MSPTPRLYPTTEHEQLLLRVALNHISPLAVEDFIALPLPNKQVWPKGSALLRAGDIAGQAGFILSGALREYYVLADGSERTRSFNLAGDFAGSLSDLLTGMPARTWVVAEMETTVISMDWHAYQQLVDSSSAWARFAGKIAEQLYLRKVEREYELLALDAAARYRRTLERWPTLESLFTQRDIASYIGITPVHLSRLRAERTQVSPAKEDDKSP